MGRILVVRRLAYLTGIISWPTTFVIRLTMSFNKAEIVREMIEGYVPLDDDGKDTDRSCKD